jgi:hypothetical protein
LSDRRSDAQGGAKIDDRHRHLIGAGDGPADRRFESQFRLEEPGGRTIRRIIFWVSLLFISHAIFAPLNATVVAAMFISSFSVAVAVNLILDTEQPFAGFIRASDAPMRQALDEMK